MEIVTFSVLSYLFLELTTNSVKICKQLLFLEFCCLFFYDSMFGKFFGESLLVFSNLESNTSFYLSVSFRQALLLSVSNICEFKIPLVPTKCHLYHLNHIFIIILLNTHFTVIHKCKSCLTGDKAIFIIRPFQVISNENCYKLLHL